MKECLVDVLGARETVLHVFPVPTEAGSAVRDEEACVREAIAAANRLQLVPESQADALRGRVHVSRRGPLTPVGDVLQVRQDDQARTEERIRTRAYFLWQQEGCPDGAAERTWSRACEMESQAA